MTDINKQIEEESEMIAREGVENLLSDKNYIDKMKLHSAIKMTYKMGYKSALHSSRWRNVSKGLPPIDNTGVSINVLINVRLKSKNQDLTCAIEGFYDFDIEEWFLLIPLPKKYKIEILSWKPVDKEDERRNTLQVD